MRVKVGRLHSAQAQDTPTLRLARLCPPEHLGTREGAHRHRQARCQAPVQQRTTAQTLEKPGMSLQCAHTSPSCVSRTGRAKHAGQYRPGRCACTVQRHQGVSTGPAGEDRKNLYKQSQRCI